MDMPDQQCNVILTYIIGAILPIVSLLMTSMVTGYLNKEENKPIEKKQEDKQLTNAIEDINNSLTELEEIIVPKQSEVIEPKIEETIEPDIEETVNEEPQREPHFINLE
jgi:hypothetical protein